MPLQLIADAGTARSTSATAAAAAAETLAHTAELFVELGAIIVGLSVLARLGSRIGLSPIPLYLIAGLCFGLGGFFPLPLSESFIQTGAEIGVILLLFMLGLEYTGPELSEGLRRGARGGLLDIALNFGPGLALGLLLGWSFVGALLLGGVTYISSSSIIAKVLSDLGRVGNRETSPVLTILVLEDLVMAVYLPLVAVLLLGQGVVQGSLSIGPGAGHGHPRAGFGAQVRRPAVERGFAQLGRGGAALDFWAVVDGVGRGADAPGLGGGGRVFGRAGAVGSGRPQSP